MDTNQTNDQSSSWDLPQTNYNPVGFPAANDDENAPKKVSDFEHSAIGSLDDDDVIDTPKVLADVDSGDGFTVDAPKESEPEAATPAPELVKPIMEEPVKDDTEDKSKALAALINEKKVVEEKDEEDDEVTIDTPSVKAAAIPASGTLAEARTKILAETKKIDTEIASLGEKKEKFEATLKKIDAMLSEEESVMSEVNALIS